MAQFNTRIGLKVDTLENWNKSKVELLNGEIAIATIAATEGTGLTEPVAMIKIGDDAKKTFKELPWSFYAKAADVHSWAKAREVVLEDQVLKFKTDSEEFKTVDLSVFVTEDELAEALGKLVDTNTAHTHTNGEGTIVTDAGGIESEVKVNLNVALELREKTIILYDKSDATKAPLAQLDATEFIKDGMLTNVEYDADTNTLTFTWNTDAGKDVTNTVELTDILDPYTAGAKIVITGTEIAHATVATPTETPGSGRKYLTGVTTDGYGHIIGVTTASESDQDLSGKKDKQTAVGNKITKAAHVLTTLTQNKNGEIAYEVKELTPEMIGAQSEGNYKTKQEVYSKTGATTKTITQVTQNENGELVVQYEDITFSEVAIPQGSGAVTIATKDSETNIITLNGGVKLNDHTLEDDSSKDDITLAKVAATGKLEDLSQDTRVCLLCGGAFDE